MKRVDPRLRSALDLQLAGWRRALDAGAARVGWKLGIGDAERIGHEIALGHLTSASVLEPGSTFVGEATESLSADAEIALAIGRDVAPDADVDAARAAIAGYAAALEIVDLTDAGRGAEAVVASNVFHRAVAFGGFHAEEPARGAEGALLINGELRESATAAVDYADRVCAAARLLGSVGERLRAGDRLITGAVVQVPVKPGDDVVADFGRLGHAAAAIGDSHLSPAPRNQSHAC